MSTTQPVPPSMVLRPEEIERFDRGNGVVTDPVRRQVELRGRTRSPPG